MAGSPHVFGGPLKIQADVTTRTTGALNNVAIPDNAAGKRPKYVLVSVDEQPNGGVYIRPCLTADAGAAGTLFFLASGDSIVLDVTGLTHIRNLQGGTSNIMTVAPVENGGSDEV